MIVFIINKIYFLMQLALVYISYLFTKFLLAKNYKLLCQALNFSLQSNKFNSRNLLQDCKLMLRKEQPEFLTMWEIWPYILDCICHKNNICT